MSIPRKVLNKLNFSVPEDVMRKIAQCAPGVVELVLIPLRQRLEERQRRRKQGAGSLQVPPHSSFSHYLWELPRQREDRPWQEVWEKGVWQREPGLGDHGRDIGLLGDE